MALEVELKYHCPEFDKIRMRLRGKRGNFLSCYLEQNLVFDTKNRSLRNKDYLLRLRRAKKSVICLKRKPDVKGSDRVKTWDESETEIHNYDQMRRILEGLGYLVAFEYEKFREKWSLNSCQICLDYLPFGSFVEIEGPEEKIFECAKDLCLDNYESTTQTYYQLHLQYREKKGLPPEESFIFTDSERSILIEKENVFC